MRTRLFALVGFVGLAAFPQAATNIKLIDWGQTPPVSADGTASIVVIPQIVDLTATGANVFYQGNAWGSRPGILQFDIKHDYDNDFVRTYVLCVQLTEGTGNATYGYKTISGYAGYLAAKIPGIVGGSDPGNLTAAALALTAWELNYDAYDPGTMTVNLANLSLDAGEIQYWQSGESLADYTTIKTQANAYIAELQALSPQEVQRFSYRYYANPYEGDEGVGFQDYIGANPVPEPASLAALAIGAAGLVLRRRRRR